VQSLYPLAHRGQLSYRPVVITETTHSLSPGWGRALRGQWLLEEGMTFLNHGSFGATPRCVLREQDRWRLRLERQPVRFMIDELKPGLRAAADELGALLGVQGEEIAFVENATSGVNAVLRSLHLDEGDEILTTTHVYGAVDKTIQFVCRRSGAVPVRAEVPFPIDDPGQALQCIERAITERTRLLVIDHITSPTALVLPIAELVERCKKRGIPVLVDGAHGPGMLDIDLRELAPDWYTGNCHKWLCSSKGCAFLWANPDSEHSRNDIHPTAISHFLDEQWPAEFDSIGTRDSSAWLSLPEALRFHQRLGGSELRARNRELARTGAELLRASLGLDRLAPDSMLGSIVTLAWPGACEGSLEESWERRRTLWEQHRIEVAVFPFAEQLYFRISAQAYNEIGDYQHLAEALLEQRRA
jgi:isopenicillin-N epimerase